MSSLDQAANSFEMLRGLVIQAGVISFRIKIGPPPAGNRLGVTAPVRTKRQNGGTLRLAQPTPATPAFVRSGHRPR